MNKLGLLSLSLLAACTDSSGRSTAQLVEVETTIQNGGSTSIDRLAMTYDGSQLREVARFQNGSPAGTAQLTYGAGGIERIDYADAEGDRATEQLTYEAGRLARSRYEIPGIRVDERTITYVGGVLDEVSTLTTSPGATGTTTLVRYEYDDAGRLAKLLELAGSQTASTELRYGSGGTLERASQFDDGAHRETFTFSLVDGRLDEVVDSHNGRHELTYDGDGRIVEIRRTTPSGTTTTEYRYGAGSIDGWTFAPAVPVPQLFDLDGAAFASFSPLHGSIEIPRDLPRATGGGGGGGGGGGPQCGFEPVSSCDTCLEASCCSETEACLVGTACDSFYQCAQPCTTQECVAVCGETNPTGQSDYQSLVSCAQAFCPTSCGS